MFQLSKSDLIEVYNHIPKLLLKQAKMVSLVGRDRNPVLLKEEKKRGSYYAITTEDGSWWLVPSKLIINTHQYEESAQFLFECQNYGVSTNGFVLKEPGKLSLLTNQQQWKLEEKGVLEFGTTAREGEMSQLQGEIEQLKDEKFQTHLSYDQLQQEYQQLQSQSSRSANECQQLRSRLQNMEEKEMEFLSQLVRRDEFKELIDLEKVQQKLLADLLKQLAQLQAETSLKQTVDVACHTIQELEKRLKKLEQRRNDNPSPSPSPTYKSTHDLNFSPSPAPPPSSSSPSPVTHRTHHPITQQTPTPVPTHREDRPRTQPQLSSYTYEQLISHPTHAPTPRDDRPQTQPQLPLQRSGSPYDQLLSLYNHNPSAIAQQATGVSETKDSKEARRAGRSQNAIFKKDRRGDYWIVEMSGQSYLVPQGSLKINEHIVKGMESSFDCYGYQTGISNRLSLAKPAVVIPVVQGKEWQLRERGALQFSYPSPSPAPVPSRAYTLPTPTQQKPQNKNVRSIPHASRDISLRSLEEPNKLSYIIQLDNFIKLYNTDPDRIVEIIPASESKESLEARLAGNQKFPRFISDRRGDYWIVPQEDTLYVVPKANLKINEHKVKAMEAAFDCHGYKASISDRFQLVKPAEVRENDGEWKLIDRGILQFKP